MRFVIGLLIGLGLGFVATVIFASSRPEKKQPEWRVGPEGELEYAGSGDHGAGDALQQTMRSLRERLNEALQEAKEAQQEAEKEMQARFEKAAGRRSKFSNK